MKKSFLSAIILLFAVPIFGQSEFLNLLKEGNLTKIKLIVAENPGILDKEIPYNSYPLHMAAEHVQLGTVKWILEQKTKVTAATPDKQGQNALHHMCRAIHLVKATSGRVDELFQLLLKNGAKINAKDKSGLTPMCYIAPRFSLIEVRTDNLVGFINLMMKNGADPNVKNKAKVPLIMMLGSAFRSGTDKAHKMNRMYFKILKALIEHGADVNAVDPTIYKNSLLIQTVKNTFPTEEEKYENIKYLLQAGAKAKYKNKKGESAKALAKNSKDKKLITIVKKTKKTKKTKKSKKKRKK